jgi:hypothetical protein
LSQISGLNGLELVGTHILFTRLLRDRRWQILWDEPCEKNARLGW